MNKITDRIFAWLDPATIEPQALEQLHNIAEMPFICDHIAVMPDCHLGKGATVGSVIATDKAIIPAAVGVDIGCVDGETEFLSPTGWKKIKDYAGEAILNFNPESGLSSWEEPKAFIKKPYEFLYHLKTKYGIDQKLSPDHKVLAWRPKGRLGSLYKETLSAQELVTEHAKLKSGSPLTIRTAPSLYLSASPSFDIEEAGLRVQVMANADGSSVGTGNTVQMKLRKPRKIERADYLLDLASIPHTRRVQKNGDVVFRFKTKLPKGDYTALWKLPSGHLQVVAEEALYWDGNLDENVFYTRKEAEADFMQFAFMAAGFRAVKRQDGKDFRVYRHLNTLVGFKSTKKAVIKKVAPSDGHAYCFTTSTGFWVMRHGGQIILVTFYG